MKPALNSETGEIDWQAFRAQIARFFDASNEALQDSAVRTREILEERARHLAKPISRGEEAAALIEVVTFRLGQETYGIETQFVQEVLRSVNISSLPGVPDFVLGVTNMRGEIIPVFDLERFLGLPTRAQLDRPQVLTVGTLRAEFAIPADSVLAVSPIAPNAIQAGASFDVPLGTECIRGITHDAVVVLDGSALVRDRRLFIDSSNAPV